MVWGSRCEEKIENWNNCLCLRDTGKQQQNFVDEPAYLPKMEYSPGSVSFFYKGPDNKYFRFCVSYSTLLLECKKEPY